MTAADAGVRAIVRGADVSARTRICVDPYVPGAGSKVSIPLEAWAIDGCPS
jgi:hypothetical protein